MHPTMRHMLAGGGLLVALALLASFIVLSSSGATAVPQSAAANNPADPTRSVVNVPFTVVAEGSQSEVERRANYLITSGESLTELWAMLSTDEPTPTVDFNTQAVVVVFAGAKSTGGYGVEVAKIEDDTRRTVYVTVSTPGPGCITTEALTSPFQVVVVPAASLSYTSRSAAAVVDCE
ncbi:hypothetical protein A2765_06690 [Candidatus Kaiserbacteria bacterium RIFCSPHIGHO2_01_FULL_56_24]|uniref:PrcB C-terminal domain-containing protein n=1 Tax=Candidatus Kaiserbacteria bacterium RIFCSPHIGHO2_01_FULL_56_24 TaxID=1798487 RepID=A0A1F6DCY3_9BACT|nr:MAG: hypothetical protein A2765_06690 [Candidatus Kaiserbacteria bacterium RIFCSPHIGHO2_01_FULL_56_24]